jgi:hypothetical protein
VLRFEPATGLSHGRMACAGRSADRHSAKQAAISNQYAPLTSNTGSALARRRAQYALTPAGCPIGPAAAGSAAGPRQGMHGFGSSASRPCSSPRGSTLGGAGVSSARRSTTPTTARRGLVPSAASPPAVAACHAGVAGVRASSVRQAQCPHQAGKGSCAVARVIGVTRGHAYARTTPPPFTHKDVST